MFSIRSREEGEGKWKTREARGERRNAETDFLTDPDGMPFLLNRLSKFFQLDISSLIIYWLYSSLIRVTNEYFPVLEEKFRQSSEYFSCSRSFLPLPTERLHRM